MEKVEKQSINSKITGAIVKSRFVIITVLLALILVAVVIGVISSVNDSKIESGLTALDELEFRYESLDTSADTFVQDQNDTLAQANALAQSSSGVVAVRSLLFIGDINFDLENWTEAKDAYMGAYEADKEAYTAPLALYNAAISSEENGDFDSAIEYLQMVKDFDDFSLMSRALFNLGRIAELQSNFSLSEEAYKTLNDEYPSTTWANLAKSRLIVLKTEGNLE